MRPRRLEIRGLRSYRQHQEIDFTGAGLIAILGDTGAGKSSILEALCVALYAGSTWSRSNVKALISSGLPTLDVVLEFTADGRDWRVHRSLPAGDYPPAIHKLVGLTDGSQIDGARAVNQRIEELVGLDYDAFLRAVLLPQGRFQALLQATESGRTSILKGILRLDVLERIRDAASARVAKLEPRVAELRAMRAVLLPDPAATAAAAERAHTDAAAERARLQAVAKRAGEATALAHELRGGADALGRSAQAARDQDPAASVAQLDGLAASGRELDLRRADLAARRAELNGECVEVAARLRSAETAGMGYEVLLGVARTVGDLRQWLGQAEQESARLEIDREAVAAKTTQLETERAAIAALDQRVAAAKAEVERQRLERDAALRRLDEGRQRLAMARRQELLCRQRRLDHAGRSSELAKARKELETERRAALAAAKASARAEAALEKNRRRHAASHAAAGIGAGDPCPVCERKLPARWQAPSAPDLESAAAASAEARESEAAGRQQVAQREERAAALEQRVQEDAAALASAEGDLRDALESLRELAGKSADPKLDDDAILKPLARGLAALEQRQVEAESRRHQEEEGRGERQAGFQRLAAEVATARRLLEAGSQRLEGERTERRRQLAALPEVLRPPGLDHGVLEQAAARVEREVSVAKEMRARHDDLSGRLQQAQLALTEHDERTERDVRRPARAAARRLDQLRAALEQLARDLEAEPPPRSDAEEASEVAAWARELAVQREALLRLVANRVRQSAAKLATAETSLRAALADAGVDSVESLQERCTVAEVALRRKADELEHARAQIEPAREIDRRLAAGAPLVDGLRELGRLLTDGKFIGHVVDRKQRSLLVVASQLLAEMTRDRYGFSEDFQVIDRHDGEPRSVMTLSGGETFLASLALALALVELAGREGGRLDALFLDEGFGSLDADALGEALEALHDQSAKGRLVAVISHLRAVAESIERVLLVIRTPAGSRVEWLGDADRTALVEEEASTGLLA